MNGQAAQQRRAGTMQVLGMEGLSVATRLHEGLPGEHGSHFIFDQDYNRALDEMEEQTVPAGHTFVLGGNRDRSADSRVPPEGAVWA